MTINVRFGRPLTEQDMHFASLGAAGWQEAAGLACWPEHFGPVGAFWPVRRPDASPCVVGEFLLHLPLAAPAARAYAVGVVHLRDAPGWEPATLFAPYMTHEFVLAAHAPAARPRLDALRVLRPFALTGQFSAASDHTARRFATRLLELCCADALSPAPEMRDEWRQFLVMRDG